MDSGSVFKFKLPFGFGYAYCKLINYEHFDTFYKYHIKIYDYFDDGKVNKVDFFRSRNYFINTIPIFRAPNLRGKGAWKLLGVLQEERDNIIPYFKSPVSEGFAFHYFEEYEARKWEIVEGIKNYKGNYSYSQVQHLEELYTRTSLSVENRLALELIRERKEDISKYFDLKNDVGAITNYHTMRFIPPYKKLPEAIREKPLIKGIVPDEYLDFDVNSLVPKEVPR